MDKKTILLDANKFSTVESFYSAVENAFTKDLGWQIGRNLNAFNDVLRGGFGVFEYEEPIRLIWLHSDKSRKELSLAEPHAGKTFFEFVVDIIKGHDHIELILQ